MLPRPEVDRTCEVLVVAPAWADPRALERETDLIRACVEGSAWRRVESRDEVEAPDLLPLLAASRPAIVHLSGRGGAPFFAGPMGGELAGHELAELFAGLGGAVECVLLNGYYNRDRGTSLGAEVGEVIGVPGELSLEAALRFWEGFYTELGRGATYETSFERGRQLAAARPNLAPCRLSRREET